MTHPCLRAPIHLSEGDAKVMGEEVGIIPKALTPPWLRQQLTGGLSANHGVAPDPALAPRARRRTDIPCSPAQPRPVRGSRYRRLRQHLLQVEIVRSIERRALQVGSTRPTLAVDPGTAIQCVHRKPGVVRQDDGARAPCKVSRLGEGVLLEAAERFESILLDRFRQTECIERQKPHADCGQQRLKFVHFTGVSRGEYHARAIAGNGYKRRR